ncbi:MAG: TonB-dependent receptor [Methyloglobulus sp.]|nr:TonB-dependent receptor [Methyloglobulus sp.]
MTGNTNTLPPSTTLSHQLLMLIFLISLLAFNTRAFAESATRQYNIPAGSLAHALNNLAEHSDLQVIYDTGLTQGLSSQGLKGSYSTAAALQKLLSGTGLVYTLSDGEVTIRAADKTQKPFVPVANPNTNKPEPMSESTLPKVTVEADSAYDPEYYADPYNKDYVIPNATAGTKTDTPIIETPLNVQVISKQVLKDRQVIRLADSLKNVSGVVTTTNSGSNGIYGGRSQSIFLRGFESQTFFRNGFRLQEGAASRELANVESVEVLKGPAAILYGLVEPGGMVNVVTKQPLATPYYGFTQQFGSYDLYRTTFDASGPLTKNKDLLYRANLSYENSGSFRDFVGKEDVFFAPVLRWNISPKTQITFEMEYNRLHQGLDNAFIPVIPSLNLSVPISRNYGGYSSGTTESIFGGFNWSHQFNDDWILKHRFSVNQQSFKTPFSTRPFQAGSKEFHGDPILGPLPNDLYVARVLGSADIQNNTTSTNLDLVGHFDTVGLKHTLLLGGDYYRLDTTINESQALNPLVSYISLTNPAAPGTPFGTLVSPGASTNFTDQYGLYIQDQIKLPYDFHVTGGIRYQYIHQGLSTPADDFSPASSSASTQDAVTPRVGILWHPKSWLSLYANYAESFGAQLNNPRSSVSPGVIKPLDPTSAAQYEGGIKFEFFNGKLRANLTYYDLTKTNVAVADPNPSHRCSAGLPSPGSASDCFIALGEVRSRGPEIDIQGEILPGWNVIATWSNTDIRISKNSGDALNPGFTVGDRLPNVPRNIGSIWNTYLVQGGEFKGLTFGGGVNLRDNQIAPNLGGIPPKIPGYATFDLMAGYSRQFGDAKVSVQLNVNNLLDKQYFSSRTDCKFCQGAWVDFGTPRTFMGQVSVQY